MILVMGGVVLMIVLAILLPIIEINQLVRWSGCCGAERGPKKARNGNRQFRAR